MSDNFDSDWARFQNTMHIPADAGDHFEGLALVLLRIPEGWGRWISCDAGWYPLITGLDTALAAIAPDYVLKQVKEKFGQLCYYIDIPDTTGWQDPLVQQAQQLIRQAELQSSVTCERCGEEGAMLHVSHDWYKTLCGSCADFYNTHEGKHFRPTSELN